MDVTVVGCGDAFGSGGRLQTSFHVKAPSGTFLIDCGASTLIGLRRLGLDPDALDAVFLTHLHGDHFAGLIWLWIDAQYVSARKRPLVVAGPRGTRERFFSVAEALYPGATARETDFTFSFLDYEGEGRAVTSGAAKVTPYEVQHPSGTTPYALRIELDGKIIAFSGDTAWVDSLCDVAQGAGLFICECYEFDRPSPVHLDYQTIEENYSRLGAKRVLLTHMGEAMLAARDKVDQGRYALAEDGMVIKL
jgi:ribonuclease BN (tRNA processing enzyme)